MKVWSLYPGGQKIFMIHFLTLMGLTPGGSSTVHIYTRKIHRTTQITTEKHQQQLIWKSAGRVLSLLILHWHLPQN